jgi:electron transfer flavoprotein alpha subunit
LTADCTKLGIGDHRIKDTVYENVLLQIRPAFGGNIIATIVSPESMPSMATVREGVMKMEDPDCSRKAEIIPEVCDLPDADFSTELIKVVREPKTVDLKSAKIIVSAGMGAADPESLSLVAELARTIGGVVGASRPVADAGVLDRCRQVGQTGTTVRPNLYIACGISGQIQHRAGMEGARRIIAVNPDPEAPIFTFAHYGIVGDVREVLPKMIKAYKATA